MEAREQQRPSAGLAGLLAEFASAEAVRAAASALRNAGWTRWDVHSPFPVHGIESAMGLRRTGLPWLVLAAALAGVLLATGMQLWTNGIDYPTDHQRKAPAEPADQRSHHVRIGSVAGSAGGFRRGACAGGPAAVRTPCALFAALPPRNDRWILRLFVGG
jgi:hypothetical protein